MMRIRRIRIHSTGTVYLLFACVQELLQADDKHPAPPAVYSTGTEYSVPIVCLRVYRNYCKRMPNILPRLLDAVKWQSRDEVSQLYLLLEVWRPVATQTALELLDCKYADLTVRSHAVGWLDAALSDEELGQYLLQLVQAGEWGECRDFSQ